MELVIIGGDFAYGRPKWIEEIAGPAEMERVNAWGKPRALDLTYSVMASSEGPPRLEELRAELLERYKQTGPIFA